MTPKRKNQISPRTRQEIAVALKWRKGEKGELPNCDPNVHENSVEDMELPLFQSQQISFNSQYNRNSQILYKIREATPLTELFKK